jgi:Na+/glutamate symporter
MKKTPKIVVRLARQLRSRGVKNALRVAMKKASQFGLVKGGKLTKKGKKRNKMTPAERAKDRAARKSGRRSSLYKYNKRTNRAKLKRKK